MSGEIEEEKCAAVFFYRQGQEINLEDTFGNLRIGTNVSNKDNLIASHGRLMDVPCDSKRQVQCGFHLHYRFVELKKSTTDFDAIADQFDEDPDGGKAFQPVGKLNLLSDTLWCGVIIPS